MEMTEARISKYSPDLRDESGSFLIDEWTSVSDIGKVRTLKPDVYLAKEGSYWQAVETILKNLQITSVTLKDLEFELPLNRLGVPELDILCDHPILNKLAENIEVDVKEFEALFRLVMRELLWFRVQASKNTFIHFGYDFYVYIGSSQPFEDPRITGIYVEPYTSPYHTEDS